MLFKKPKKTSSDTKDIQKQIKALKDHYTIKGDGALQINLRTAVKSERFQESIRRIKSHDLQTG